jgi:hypothetical protein
MLQIKNIIELLKGAIENKNLLECNKIIKEIEKSK